MGEKKKPQLDTLSPESSLTQGDSDSESTSVSSSIQGSISSATSSFDQYSSNVKGETKQKKTLNKSISKKLATFGSFMSSRRQAQSKLSQSSVKLSDDGSTTPSQHSSIEVSDESSNYVQKPMPKFTRTGSLRSVKIFRSKSKSKNKSSYKSKKSSIDKNSEISRESHSEKATFSSILKDSKFPEDLKHQPGPLEPEEVLPVAKLCPYQHCSLHGRHHHHHEPPTKRFPYLKRNTTKDQKIVKPETRSMDKSFGKKREVKVPKKGSNAKTEDFSIEFYAKTRSEPLSSHRNDVVFADILFGMNNFHEKKNEIPMSNHQDSSDLKDENETPISNNEDSSDLKDPNETPVSNHQDSSDIKDENETPVTNNQDSSDLKDKNETPWNKQNSCDLTDQNEASMPGHQDSSGLTPMSNHQDAEDQDDENKTPMSNIQDSSDLKDKKETPMSDHQDSSDLTNENKTPMSDHQDSHDLKDEFKTLMLDHQDSRDLTEENETPMTDHQDSSDLKDKNETPISNHQDSSDINDKDDVNSDGSMSVLEKKPPLKKENSMSMWHMIHQHMVSGLAAESGDPILHQVDDEKKSNTKDFDDAASQETEIRKMFAIKLVRDAIEKILLPEVQDDQSTTSEVSSEQDLSEKNQDGSGITNDQKVDKLPEAEAEAEVPGKTKTENRAPKRWSYLKKVIVLKRFITELEKVKKFNPKKPTHLPVVSRPENETVKLRRQMAGEKKNSDEWMLDYALQKVVGELAPTQKRKVALLVKAFETVAPAQEDPQESKSNTELKRANSEIKMTECGSFAEKENHIKMWHMIYQHVVTDIATKIGSELLDGEETINGDEKNLQEFTQSDAVELVRESVDEILKPDVEDEGESRKNEIDFMTVSRLQQQKSKNWGKLKKLILLKRSIKALEGFRKAKPERRMLESAKEEEERVDLRRQMMDERKKAEQWMLDYAVQHIVTKLTPARKKRVSMLVEAFEAVVPLPEI